MTRQRLLEVARSQIGYKEGANNDTKYGIWYGMNHQPWCMMFVSWCADQAKIPVSIIPKLSYVPYFVEFFKKQKRYKGKDYVPNPGDLIIYGSNSHVGIVESVNGNSVYTIEGNTSSGGNNANGDGVYRRIRNLKDAWITGYCVPDMEDMTKVKIDIKDLDSDKYIPVEAVNVDGNNYIKLRDAELLFPVEIGWDGKTPTIKLNKKNGK